MKRKHAAITVPAERPGPVEVPEMLSLTEAAAQIPSLPNSRHGKNKTLSSQRLYYYCITNRVGQFVMGQWRISREELAWFIEHGRGPVGMPRYVPTLKTRELVRKHLEMKKYAGALTERERQGVVWRFGLDDGGSPLRLRDLGEAWGVTRERASQIVDAALKKVGLPHEVELKRQMDGK